MSNDAATLLVGASTDFLRNFSPFNRMEAEALGFLAERAVLAFHARGSEILTPESGVPTHFHIVQRGKIQARQAGQATVTEYTSLTLGPGECFPIGAISARRPSTNAYVAVEDSFCFQISADDFLHLMQISPVFHLFCTQYIASLLSQSRQQLQSSFAQRAAEQQTMTTALGKLIKQDPVFVTPDTPTRSALERMSELHLGCMVVVDAERHPVGILTQSDLLPRVILAGFDLARPIGELMTANPHQLPASASAYDAALEMATHGVRHLLTAPRSPTTTGKVERFHKTALDAGLDILVICNCCFASLQKAKNVLEKDSVLKDEFNTLLAKEGLTYHGATRIRHYLTVLHEDVGITAIRNKLVNTCKGLKLSVIHGCHILRPREITQFDDSFVPRITEDLVEVTGATSIDWRGRMECCGAALAGLNDELSRRLLQEKITGAREAGADYITPICSYCHLQFDTTQTNMAAEAGPGADLLPVLLYPQLLGLCLGINERRLGIASNRTIKVGDIDHITSLLAPPVEEKKKKVRQQAA